MLKIDRTNSLKGENFHLGVEVGVRTGWYAKYILDHTDMTLHAIDPWENNAELANAESVYAECQARLSAYTDRVKIVKAYSPAVTGEYEDGILDFIYIDALHDYESVKKDMTAWWPKLRVGGILAGHDFSPSHWPGVVRAVHEFTQEKEVQYYLTGIVGNAVASFTGDLDEYDGDEQSWFCIKQ